MNFITDVIRVICKPPDQRTDGEISSIVAWLRKINQTLADLDNDVLVPIVRQCQYRKVDSNWLVIRQGERSDGFYILLRGKAGVYVGKAQAKLAATDNKLLAAPLPVSAVSRKASKVRRDSKIGTGSRPTSGTAKDATLSDRSPVSIAIESTPFITETPALFGQSTSTKTSVGDQRRHVSEQSLSSFGQRVNTYESGSYFDERAFAQPDGVCNESVISEDECEFMVVDMELYGNAFKLHQEQEARLQRAAVDNCYLFSGWFKKFKNVVESSLKKEVIEPNNTIVKQGDDADKLILIHSGMVQLSTHIDLHVDQFEEFFTREIPKIKFDDDMASTTSQDDDQIASLYFKVNIEESVRLSFKPLKTTEVAILQPNSVIGDFEVCLNLPIYPFTYTALTKTVVYILDREVLERIYNERNRLSAQFLNTTIRLVQTIEDRINSRFGLNSSLKEELLIFRRALTYIGYLKYLIKKQQRRGRLKSASGDGAHAQASDPETDQLLKLYLANRLQLIRPFVKTSVADWTYHHAHQPFWRHVLHEKGKDKYSLYERKSDSQTRRPRSTQELQREYGYTRLREVGLHPTMRAVYGEPSANDLDGESGMGFDLDEVRRRVLAAQMTPSERVAEYEQLYGSFDLEAFSNLFSKYKSAKSTKPSTSSGRLSAVSLSSSMALRSAVAQSEKQSAAKNSEMDNLEGKITDFLADVNSFNHRKANNMLTKLTDQRENVRSDKASSNQQAIPSRKNVIRPLKREQINPSKLPLRGTTVLMHATRCPCKSSEALMGEENEDESGIAFVHDHVRSFVVPSYVMEFADKKDLETVQED